MCDHCGCRSFPPIAELTREHDAILECAWVAAHPGAGQASAVAKLRSLLDGHVRKEETGLYPALLSCEAVDEEQIGGLESEHRELHAALEAGAFDRVRYYELAAHIEEEEMELFPLAMFGFDEDDWEATAAAHRAVDDSVPVG